MKIYAFVIVLSLATTSAISTAQTKSLAPPSVYFDLPKHLIVTLQGTYEFKHEVVTYTKVGHSYAIDMHGDESPLHGTLEVTDSSIKEILQWSGETWRVFKVPITKGRCWEAQLRGSQMHYEVNDTGISVTTPAGVFHGCALITISWLGKGEDNRGPHKELLYLAPHLGVVKRMEYIFDDLWHQDVVTSTDER